jgi:hypothetical protein
MKTQIKKSLLPILFFCTFFAAHSQEAKTNELTLGYGVITTSSSLDFFKNFFLLPAFTGGSHRAENYTYSGASYISYSHTLKDNFSIGAELVYERISKDIFTSSTKDGRQIDNNLTIAAHAKYSYIVNPKFRMYSGLGAGYTTTQAKFTPVENSLYKASKGNIGSFNVHVTALGFRFGKKAAVSAELGFGYKGIANIGFSYQL